MLSTKEITKMYKGTKITSRVDLYKATKSGSKSSQQQECRGVVLRNLQVANFRNLAKFSLCLPSLQHFCSKFPLVQSCIFEFGSGSSCLNRIENNEVFGLQNYQNSYKSVISSEARTSMYQLGYLS